MNSVSVLWKLLLETSGNRRFFVGMRLLQNSVYKADPGSVPSVYDPPM